MAFCEVAPCSLPDLASRGNWRRSGPSRPSLGNRSYERTRCVVGVGYNYLGNWDSGDVYQMPRVRPRFFPRTLVPFPVMEQSMSILWQQNRDVFFASQAEPLSVAVDRTRASHESADAMRRPAHRPRFSALLLFAFLSCSSCDSFRNVQAMKRAQESIQAECGVSASISANTFKGASAPTKSTVVTVRLPEVPSARQEHIESRVKQIVRAEFPRAEKIVIVYATPARLNDKFQNQNSSVE